MTVKENIGACYKLNYQYQKENIGWILMHGYITFPGKDSSIISYAWCMKNNTVYDAVLGQEFKWDIYKALYNAKIEKQYIFNETLNMYLKYETYGPW